MNNESFLFNPPPPPSRDPGYLDLPPPIPSMLSASNWIEADLLASSREMSVAGNHA